jgi:hypothetical protein
MVNSEHRNNSALQDLNRMMTGARRNPGFCTCAHNLMGGLIEDPETGILAWWYVTPLEEKQ